MDLITGKGPSNRHELSYFAEGTLGAVRVNDFKYRFIDQPGGWLGNTVKVDWPLDPLERTSLPSQSMNQYSWFAYDFWRFVLVQQIVGQYAQTFLEFPPMQKGASFNLQQLEEEMEEKMENQGAQ
jgi:hypothetical protein